MSRESIKAKIAMARKIGMSDGEILAAALANVYGPTKRREMIVEWGEYLGLEASDALKIGLSAHLIPTAGPPRAKK